MYSANINKIVIISICHHFHLYIHAYALLLLARGLTLVQITLIESVLIGAIFLMEVPTGILADRVGRKWSIICSTFLLMCAEFVFIFARDYQWYVLVALLAGTGYAFASGAIEALVYDSLPAENREAEMKRVIGRVKSYSMMALALAPIVGGFIIGDASIENFIPAIVLTVVALFIGLLVCLTLREPAQDSSEAKPSSLSLLRDGASLLLHNRRLRWLALLAVFTTPFIDTLAVTLGPPYLVQHDVSPFAIAAVLSAGSLLAALTQRFAYKVEAWLGRDRAIAALILLPGLLYWILAAVAGPIATAAIVILLYGCGEMSSPLFSAYQNALIESKNRATVLSLINMFISLFVAAGAPVYAALAQRSLAGAFLVMGGVIVAATLLLRAHRLSPAPAS
jgi:MFS family permease